jgi:hypothetical protein
MSSIQPVGLQFCGVPVSEQQLSLIQSTVHSYRRLSRTELAATLCELLGWLRPNGKPKTVECRQFLEQLADPEDAGGRMPGFSSRVVASYDARVDTVPPRGKRQDPRCSVLRS